MGACKRWLDSKGAFITIGGIIYYSIKIFGSDNVKSLLDITPDTQEVLELENRALRTQLNNLRTISASRGTGQLKHLG